MKSLFNRCWNLGRLSCGLALGLLALCLAARAAAAEGLAFESASQPTQWTLTYDRRPVMVYAFEPQQYKPYVRALHTLRGDNVLRDAPYDHLHHHALMYGIRVNGINFWEETAGCGVQKVIESPPPQILREAKLPQIRVTQRLYWVAPEHAFLPNTNTPALLIEQRTLTLSLDPANRETALHWKSEFEVGPRTNVVTLTGANYHGLGMRFLQPMDPVAVHFSPEGKLDLANNRQDVSANPWEAVAFDLPGSPVTLALFGAAANARGAARFFAMKSPFAYLSATQGLDQEPLVYRRGERFELNYLVVVFPETKSATALTERSRRWSGGRD